MREPFFQMFWNRLSAVGKQNSALCECPLLLHQLRPLEELLCCAEHFLTALNIFYCAEFVCCFEHFFTVLNVFCALNIFLLLWTFLTALNLFAVLNIFLLCWTFSVHWTFLCGADFFCSEHLLLWWKIYAALNILMLCWTFFPSALVHVSAVLQLLPCRRIQQTCAPALESDALCHICLSS